MQFQILLGAALSATTIVAAPTWPQVNVNAAMTDGIETVSEYFNMLASKVEAGKLMKAAPVCDLSKAQMPLAPTPMAGPAAGLILKHVAIGRGTQNYTCDTTNSTAVPAAAGALATLFDASCLASAYPDLLHMLPKLALRFDLPLPAATTADDDEDDGVAQRMGPADLAVSGTHYFTDDMTPFFNLDTSRAALGEAGCTKEEATPAPADAPAGQGDEPAVAWLRLSTLDGATGGLREVWRVETAGGSPPESCQGMPAAFEVQYAAEYWFYEGVPES
ncbi:hypothetical protein DL766_009859 [Monosporascus sp. MC13-8B]|uniref:Malate dehydrogenase n=1 Tax=Monosporascus cannonballus TaxID=155416 RepID=A0ABY0H516_9PEZI|nr:hypothetical protein DL762_005597 [Monosporascus cannonballus]RYO88804.1 hypothetical protein DL763_005884 [Monosporascus cannonballus]RYP13371.1 hypothetical protein DL766_009859 [Monosporascus sp. MC13-8B]